MISLGVGGEVRRLKALRRLSNTQHESRRGFPPHHHFSGYGNGDGDGDGELAGIVLTVVCYQVDE